jgi:hypothetical protein
MRPQARVRTLLGVVICQALFLSCSAHSPMIVKNTVSTTKPATQLAPHHEKVFITEDSLPAASYDYVAVIDVGKIWYGGSTAVLVSIAERAREVGADAVIEVKTWHQPSGFSWAAPHGSGTAIKFKNKAEIDFSKLHGNWM